MGSFERVCRPLIYTELLRFPHLADEKQMWSLGRDFFKELFKKNNQYLWRLNRHIL